MTERVEKAARMNCDAVEPDNMMVSSFKRQRLRIPHEDSFAALTLSYPPHVPWYHAASRMVYAMNPLNPFSLNCHSSTSERGKFHAIRTVNLGGQENW